jgi:hypothetical protein
MVGSLVRGRSAALELQLQSTPSFAKIESSGECWDEIQNQESASDGQLSLIAAGTWGDVFAVVCSVREGHVTLCVQAGPRARSSGKASPCAELAPPDK